MKLAKIATVLIVVMLCIKTCSLNHEVNELKQLIVATDIQVINAAQQMQHISKELEALKQPTKEAAK